MIDICSIVLPALKKHQYNFIIMNVRKFKTTLKTERCRMRVTVTGRGTRPNNPTCGTRTISSDHKDCRYMGQYANKCANGDAWGTGAMLPQKTACPTRYKTVGVMLPPRYKFAPHKHHAKFCTMR